MVGEVFATVYRLKVHLAIIPGDAVLVVDVLPGYGVVPEPRNGSEAVNLNGGPSVWIAPPYFVALYIRLVTGV
jgi:hypothetical protein